MKEFVGGRLSRFVVVYQQFFHHVRLKLSDELSNVLYTRKIKSNDKFLR